MDFGLALDELTNGFSVFRHGWNGKDQKLYLLEPTEEDVVTRPYIAFDNGKGDVVPWVASQTDLLSDDWEALDDE